MKMPKGFLGLVVIGLSAGMVSCKEQSPTTGWNINDQKNGGFEANFNYYGQETGPGLIFIEGGTFTMGRTEQDVMYDWNNRPRKVTVSSYYMDEFEVTNVAYREYVYWLKRVYGESYPEVVKNALPDTLVWRTPMAFNEPLIENYYRHPAYLQYPVVGVNWLQASDFCAWRTDRVNEQILIDRGVLRVNPNQYDDDVFTTETYLYGLYIGEVRNNLEDKNPNGDPNGRHVRVEDGILLPDYRLPTEAEWEFAALGLAGNTDMERVTEKRLYPWDGHDTRSHYKKNKGQMLANYKRGKGDQMGVAGWLNDGYDITAPVGMYPPNDYGLYDMAGNVAEWVLDVYRPVSNDDVDDFRAFRGNVYETQARDEEGYLAELDSLGRMQYAPVSEEDNLDRRNYRKSDYRDLYDGDLESSIYYNKSVAEGQAPMYEYGVASIINNTTRVYKGGSWKDRAYWLVPGTGRFLEQDQATDYIGFRCAMDRVGEPTEY